jgi:hypothetical protein
MVRRCHWATVLCSSRMMGHALSGDACHVMGARTRRGGEGGGHNGGHPSREPAMRRGLPRHGASADRAVCAGVVSATAPPLSPAGRPVRAMISDGRVTRTLQRHPGQRGDPGQRSSALTWSAHDTTPWTPLGPLPGAGPRPRSHARLAPSPCHALGVTTSVKIGEGEDEERGQGTARPLTRCVHRL